jgi:hypothetical protein
MTTAIWEATERAYARGVSLRDVPAEADRWARAYLRRCRNLRNVSEAVSVRRAITYREEFIRAAYRVYQIETRNPAYMAYDLYRAGLYPQAIALCALWNYTRVA